MGEVIVYDSGSIAKVGLNEDTVFEDCEFQRIDFTAYDLKRVSFLSCKFHGCNLANANFTNCSVRDCTFESCNMIGINWCVLRRFETPRFIGSKINLSSFQSQKLKNIVVKDCAAVDVDFGGADLTSGDFSGTNLTGTNFDSANLTDTDFRSATNYLFDIRKVKMKGARFSLPHVLALMTVLGAEIEY